MDGEIDLDEMKRETRHLRLASQASAIDSTTEHNMGEDQIEEEVRGIEREIKRLYLASRRRRMKSAASDDIEGRILSLKQDLARLRLIQGIALSPHQPPPPPDGKKE